LRLAVDSKFLTDLPPYRLAGSFLKEISVIVRAICQELYTKEEKYNRYYTAEATLLRSQRLGLGRGGSCPLYHITSRTGCRIGGLTRGEEGHGVPFRLGWSRLSKIRFALVIPILKACDLYDRIRRSGDVNRWQEGTWAWGFYPSGMTF
jgi:hypothetical protein